MIAATGFQIQMTMTIGDVIVAGVTLAAVIGAYYAVKGNLAGVMVAVNGHGETLEEHTKTLGKHDRQIVRLDAQVFGRRRTDPDIADAEFDS